MGLEPPGDAGRSPPVAGSSSHRDCSRDHAQVALTLPFPQVVPAISRQSRRSPMLSDALLVTTVAVTDLEAAGRFFSEQLGLPLLDTTPFALRFGCGSGQI